MNIISINDKKWLTELEWEMLPNEEPKNKEIKNAYQKNKCRYGLEIGHEGIVVVGFSPKMMTQPSAMLYLSLANQENNMADENAGIGDWVVIESVGEDSFWMGVVKNGLPAPGYDKVENLQKTKDRLFDLLQGGSYIIYSRAEEIKYFVEGTVELREKGLNDLTEGIKAKIKMKKIVGVPNFILIGGAVMTLGLVGFFGVTQLLESIDMEKQAQKSAASDREAAARAQEEYRRDLEKYDKESKAAKETFEKQLKTDLSLDSKTALINWINYLLDFKFKTNNWNLIEFKCDVVSSEAKSESCSLDFLRTRFGTYKLLLEDYPEAVTSGENAKLGVTVNQKFSSLDKGLNNITTLSNFTKNMGSDLQIFNLVGVGTMVDNPTELTYLIPGKPLSPEQKATGAQPNPPETIKSDISMGSLVLSGENLQRASDLVTELNMNDLVLESFNTKLQGSKITWTIKFKYYVKK